MIILIYDPIDGQPIADGMACKFAQEIITRHHKWIEQYPEIPVDYRLSTTNVSEWIRWLIWKGDISSDDVKFQSPLRTNVVLDRFGRSHDLGQLNKAGYNWFQRILFDLMAPHPPEIGDTRANYGLFFDAYQDNPYNTTE